MNKRFLDNITEFIFIEHQPQPADILFVPGNGFPDMAIKAAGLWHEQYVPYILISGKYGKLAGRFQTVLKDGDCYYGNYETECEFLRNVLLGEGVLDEAILKENQATYTYENAFYSKQLTQQMGMQIEKAIICCHTYHARRSLMYYQLLFPETQFVICPQDTGINRENWYRTEKGIEIVLGEVERCGIQFHEIIKGCCSN